MSSTSYFCAVVEINAGDYKVVTPGDVQKLPPYSMDSFHREFKPGRYANNPYFYVSGGQGTASVEAFRAQVSAAIESMEAPSSLAAVREVLSKNAVFSVAPIVPLKLANLLEDIIYKK